MFLVIFFVSHFYNYEKNLMKKVFVKQFSLRPSKFTPYFQQEIIKFTFLKIFAQSKISRVLLAVRKVQKIGNDPLKFSEDLYPIKIEQNVIPSVNCNIFKRSSLIA